MRIRPKYICLINWLNFSTAWNLSTHELYRYWVINHKFISLRRNQRHLTIAWVWNSYKIGRIQLRHTLSTECIESEAKMERILVSEKATRLFTFAACFLIPRKSITLYHILPHKFFYFTRWKRITTQTRILPKIHTNPIE